MVVARRRQPEQALQEDVQVRRGLEIGAADHVRDPLARVVHDNGEMVARRHLLAHHHGVSPAGRRRRNRLFGAVPVERTYDGSRPTWARARSDASRHAWLSPPAARACAVAAGTERQVPGYSADPSGSRGQAAPLARSRSATAAVICARVQKHGYASPASRKGAKAARYSSKCSDCRRTGRSQVTPSQWRSSSMASASSGRQRVTSMSSMRKRKRPPQARASSAFSSAE
jgi:hypothetical protein